MDVPQPRARLIVESLPPAGSRIRLPAGEASHARARRLRVGDAVGLVDGSGRHARARVVSLGSGGVELSVDAVAQAPALAGRPDVTLLVGAVRPERMSWLVEKATELGVRRIVLVRSARTQAFRAAEAAVTRLERVARAASKQSEQDRWPEIVGPAALEDALEQDDSAQRFLLDLEGEDLPERLDRASAAVLVGPEGGWTPPEREAARRSGWRPARLPAGKLRTETAAVAAIVLLRAAMGRKT
ncbi:MAG: 16S rRNA (uracil(1498)-N(3))-methyltransferase [Thermoanaerobaculia bacterium]